MILDGDVVVIHRVLSDSDLVFRGELEQLVARRGIEVHYVVGDHAAAEGHGLLTTAHLREASCLDIVEPRCLRVAGSPGMVAWMLPNIRRAGILARRLHVERFAL